MENQLQKIVQTSGLQPAQAKSLLDSFGDYFVKAHKLVALAKGIKVTNIGQVEDMKKARELRIQLKNIRNEAEKKKVLLKEGYLRGGNAVQSIYNDIRDIVKPEEDRLEEQEKFKEREEARIAEEKHVGRVAKLSQYVNDVSMYSLRDMTDEVFTKLLEDQKLVFKARLEDEKKAEDERLAKIEADRKEQERIRLENIKLRKEAEDKEKLLEIERKKQAEVLRLEQEKREKFEAKVRAEREAEAKKQAYAQAKIDAEKRQQEEEARKKLLAPDKVKLIDLATTIDKIVLPVMSSNEAGNILNKAVKQLEAVSNYIRQEAKKL